MFTCIDCRYSIQIGDLIEARKKCDLNKSQFARLCGWSPQYQSLLECGKVPSISERTKMIIERALNDNANDSNKSEQITTLEKAQNVVPL